MRSLSLGLRRSSLFSASMLVLAVACSREPDVGPPNQGGAAGTASPPPTLARATEAIPSEHLGAVLRAHYDGLGAMERYEYDRAVAAFREVRRHAPNWNAGRVNLAIALLNQKGNTGPGGAAEAHDTPYAEALGLLDEALKLEPGHLHAHYCRGIIYESLGRLTTAHQDFAAVAKHDPRDAMTWYKLASTLTDPEDPDRPAGPGQAKDLIPLYQKALELNPYLVSALYKLQAAYAWSGQTDQQKQVMNFWRRLNPRNNAAAPGETTDTIYGEMGRYASIIDPGDRAESKKTLGPPPRFETPKAIELGLPEGERWASTADFEGELAQVGRLRSRFGAGVASFDANGDGRLDLFLTAAVHTSRGVRDALLLNQGEGRFKDATGEFGLPVDRPSLGAAAGDFDADGHVDLVLTGVGGIRLFRNRGQAFDPVALAPEFNTPSTVSLTARWLDLDQDGDLDLYVVNHGRLPDEKKAEGKTNLSGIPNLVLRNDGKAPPVVGRPQDNWAPLAVATADLPATAGLSVAFSAWPDAQGLAGRPGRHTALAALDLDEDRDIDLVLAADDAPLVALVNDRLGRFHPVELSPAGSSRRVDGLLVADVDKDGHPDLIAPSRSDRLQVWRNAFNRRKADASIPLENWPNDAAGWSVATATDLDLDTWPDLIGLATTTDATFPSWARNDGARLTSSALALGPVPEARNQPLGLALCDAVGDPLPDLVVTVDGDAPRIARNLGNGQRWIGLDLAGRWKVYPAPMRSNPHGIGTRVALEGEGLKVTYDQTTREGGLVQSVGPVVLGLGTSPSAPLLRLRWPDGTMQCELNVTADKTLKVVEHNRKTGSCPVLFTWNGARFVCQGDFLGGGGLGYLIAPGVYGQPDRDESVAIAPGELTPVDGSYRLVVCEPMDECAYLDRLTLEVVDRPKEIQVAPDERFAPEGPRPTGEALAWRTSIEPVVATDLNGREVTDQLRVWDRRTVDGFARRNGWIGYAETHGIVLDFGDRLSRFAKETPLILCLAGWVEYPYSQTNYAAATAGVPLVPPAIERQRDDGTWEVIEPNAGYPAGLPRLMTLELTGRLTGPNCKLRIKTNMECYWDQAFVAVREHNLPVRISTLPVARAQLAERGYLREVSPDGRLPLLYDYERVDPAPLARMKGQLTRLGDVASLLLGDDDRLCVIGPGDEVRLEFDASLAPDLPPGWTRSFILKSVGYCKDADPFTLTSDTVGPLPWQRMPVYPYSPSEARPDDPDYRSYLEEFQTRSSETR